MVKNGFKGKNNEALGFRNKKEEEGSGYDGNEED